MGTEKPHLSISQLDMLSRCGEQYHRRYIRGEIIPPAIAMLVGRTIDGTVNPNLGRKLEKAPLMSLEEIADLAASCFNKEWDKGDVWLTDEEAVLGIKAAKGNALDKSVRLSKLHAAELAPAIEPTHLQRKVKVELPNYPYDLLGFIDIQEGSKSIRDTKSSGKTPPKDIADKSDQLTMYGMMALVIDGVIPKNFYLDYLIDLKTPKSQVFASQRDKQDFKPILRRIEAASLALEKGVFIPARETDWWCNKKWCGYWPTCPYVKRERRPINGKN